MNNIYNNLRAGAPARLREYKRRAEKSLETIRKHRTPEQAAEFIEHGGYLENGKPNWRKERWITPHGLGFAAPRCEFTAGESCGRKVYFADTGALDHLRHVQPCDEVTRNIQHTGWFTSDFQDETVRGYVAQLPARNRQEQWLAFVVWSDCDGITIDADIAPNSLTAANWADGLAERIADDAREANRIESARCERCALHDDAQQAIADFHALRESVKSRELPVPVCDTVKEKMHELRELVRDNMRRAAELREEFDLSREWG